MTYSTPANRVIAGIAILVLLLAAYWLLHRSGALTLVLDRAELRAWLGQFGVLGPLLVIGLMTMAVLISPVPSAPIALAAGAVYGHTWGTIYVLLGAEAGALSAFAVARLVGHDVLRRWLGERLSVGLLGSQTALMTTVFVSRLLPFISFDVLSYAAGLTVLSFWRFALATFAGIVPASFLLAHFGDEMATGDGEWLWLTALALGAFTAIPIAVAVIRDRRRRRRTGASGLAAQEKISDSMARGGKSP